MVCVCVCVRHHSNFSTEDSFKSLPMLHRPTKPLSGGCLVVSGGVWSMSGGHCCLAPCKSVPNYGPSTEPKIYIVKSARTPIPTSNGHISETKRRIFRSAGAKILLSPRAFTYSFMKVASRHSFTLFRPLSARKNHFFGVFQVSPSVSLWSEYGPGTTFHVGKNKFTWPPIVWLAV